MAKHAVFFQATRRAGAGAMAPAPAPTADTRPQPAASGR